MAPPHGGGDSDNCAHGGDMSISRSQWTWQLRCRAAQQDGAPRPMGPEDCHQGQGGGGGRDSLRPTSTDHSTSQGAIGRPPEPGPQRSDRTVRRSAGDVLPQLRHTVSAELCERGSGLRHSRLPPLSQSVAAMEQEE